MENYPAKAGNKNERITKMKKTKQILSVFLSVCMIISCMVGMSVTASATSLTMNDLVTAVGTSTFNWSGYKVQVVEGKLMYVTPWNSEEARDLTYNSSDGKYHLKFGIFDNDWYIVIDSDNYITSFMGDNGAISHLSWVITVVHMNRIVEKVSMH